MIAGAGPAPTQAFKHYGFNLGLAFQLVDDALDYSGRQAVMGKSVGDDFRECKVTLPLVLSLSRASEEERRFWRRTIEVGVQEEGDLSRAIEYLERGGALSETVERARSYPDGARCALGLRTDGDPHSPCRHRRFRRGARVLAIRSSSAGRRCRAPRSVSL